MDLNRYNQRLKLIITRARKAAGTAKKPASLKKTAKQCGADNKYLSIRLWTKGIKRPISYESLKALAKLDTQKRSPLQLKYYLEGKRIPDYQKLSKNQLIDLLISCKEST